jgi:hypothetical protein
VQLKKKAIEANIDTDFISCDSPYIILTLLKNTIHSREQKEILNQLNIATMNLYKVKTAFTMEFMKQNQNHLENQPDEIPQIPNKLAYHGKYNPLYSYLKEIPSNISSLDLTFEKIKNEIGIELPFSASKYRAWWANAGNPNQHPYCQSWLQAGWKVDTVDLMNQIVYFKRI